MPKATSLAADIKKKYGVDAQLIEGKGGVFEVLANGKLVFSKKKLGRFPEGKEVYEALDAAR